jgi:hypothetical protein
MDCFRLRSSSYGGHVAFAARNDGGRTSAFPRHEIVRVMRLSWPSEAGGRRECRVPLHPRASCAQNAQTSHTGRPQVQPVTRRHSLRDGSRLIRALLGVRAVLATIALRYVPQGLIPASGDQDHTISLVRDDVFAGALARAEPHPVHRILSPTFRDDREPPLLWKQDARRESQISEKWKRNFEKWKRNILRGGLDRGDVIEMAEENCGFGAAGTVSL